MSVSNDSVAVTPGTGTLIATHLVGGKEYQVLMIADGSGDIQGSNPVYRLLIPSQAVGANKLFCDLFNNTGSGKTIKVLSAFAYANNSVAVTGTLGVAISLFRTSAVGTGGTAATNNGVVNTEATISSFDASSANVPAQITARLTPTGGATISAWLGTRYVFTEETNAATALAGISGAEFIRNEGANLIIREGQGILFKQGTVASVGNVTFEVTFELI